MVVDKMACRLVSRLTAICKISSATSPRVCTRLFSVNFKSPPNLILQMDKNAMRTRTFYTLLKKPTPDKLKVMDKIPNEYVLIYRNGMQRYLLLAQVGSFVSMVVGGLIILMNDFWNYDGTSQDLNREQMAAPMENEILIYIACFITVCVILQVMVGKMPLRIYNLPHKDKYVFVFYGTIPVTKKQVTCKVKEVVKIEESGLLPWKDSRYEIVNKQKLIMLETFFRKPADLHIMLGYQQPPENYE